jgi:predicted nucleic acid-binding protein
MKSLEQLPDGTAVFIDTNIFVLAGSAGPIGLACQQLLSRVRQGLVQGFTATFVVAEVTHRVMVNEARQQLQRSARETVEYLQQNPALIRSLTRHLTVASDIGKAGVDILPLTVKDLHASKAYRRDDGLLTNDSLIVAVMRNQKLRHLASHDGGFDRVSGLQLWNPGSA